MQNPSVHWSEGMFLRPHHFQAADRYWSEFTSLHYQWDHPYGYGVSQVTISNDALENGVLEMVGLRARLRDGTIIAKESNDVETVDIKARIDQAASGGQPVMVFLAVPHATQGRANVSSNLGDIKSRYTAIQREVDDEGSGGSRQDVGLRELRHCILFSTEDTSGFETIPLLRLIRSTTDGRKFRVDPNYFPPSITIQSWGELATLIRDLRNFLGSRIKVIGSIVEHKGISLATQVQGDLEKILLMHVLNESYGELSCLAFASGVHPLVAYTSLCSMVGRCSIFGPTAAIEEVPKYDHDDLATIFRWASDQIRRLVNAVKEDEYIQRPFVGAGKGMHVALEPEWFGPEWDWYFGVSPINFSTEECFQLLKESLDWKLGAAEKVEQYMTHRQPGLKLRGVRELPRGLANRGKWVFLQISLDNEPWTQVQLSQTMAMRVRTEQISNLDTLDGSRRLHVTVGGQAYGLEFAIFAVKKRI
jgi:type VI secretion system protein ImpJ